MYMPVLEYATAPGDLMQYESSRFNVHSCTTAAKPHTSKPMSRVGLKNRASEYVAFSSCSLCVAVRSCSIVGVAQQHTVILTVLLVLVLASCLNLCDYVDDLKRTNSNIFAKLCCFLVNV